MKQKIKLLSVAASLFMLSNAAAQPINVVAAANLKSAMDSILKIYKAQNLSEQVSVIYGASGKFYEQIVSGAPFDIFFSADVDYPQKLRDAKFAITPVKIYAVGKIALWSKKMDCEKLQLNSFTNANKIAIANPATAPYGARAIESLKFYKIYDKVKNKLVYGDNIAQAAQFVDFGAADVGIIALSEVLALSQKTPNNHYYLLPQSSYRPILQGGIILKHAQNNAAATNFYNFIFSEKAIAILTYFGYSQKK